MSLRRFRTFLIILAVMIIGLMALGAGVRTMNAGLSCPDWPLCFGKLIPDFHVGVWFEFVHRAYAGIVAIFYVVAIVTALKSKVVPKSTKVAAGFGLAFLVTQIVMGALTVLMLVKATVVTAHLLLATLFFACVLWMLFGVHGELGKPDLAATKLKLRGSMRLVSFLLPIIVFVQIAIGGLVASTYAGMICVDWPYCNGQWVPTLKGPMGLQVIHRFYAYGLVVLFLGLAAYTFSKRDVIPKRHARYFYAGAVAVLLQTVVGILNLIYFIPPHITVLHQTLAMVLLAIGLKIAFEIRASASPAAGTATLS